MIQDFHLLVLLLFFQKMAQKVFLRSHSRLALLDAAGPRVFLQ
jgi:hypothetical protein